MADQPKLSAEDLGRVLEATLAVARAATTSTPEVLAELALDRALDLVPCDRASFFVLDPLTDEAVRLAWREREPLESARFAPGVGAVGWAVANRAPLLVSDAKRDPRYQPTRYPNTRSLITLPLEWDGRATGALCCTAFSVDAFTAAHLEMLRLFGEHVSAALAASRGSRPSEGSPPAVHSLAEYAHEVRGPLHTALGYLSLATQEPDSSNAEAIAHARRACQQALEIADTVLDAVAEERQNLASIPLSRPTDLAELLRTCSARAQLAAELRSVRVETALEVHPCMVAGRQHGIERLLDNLFLNAVEHSPEGGTVEARLSSQGDRAVLIVEDQGPGIPEGDLEKIFAPFYRTTNGRRGRSGGLGLSLARRWATQCGGRLWAENRAGGGARLTLQLPLLPAGALQPHKNGHPITGDA